MLIHTLKKLKSGSLRIKSKDTDIVTVSAATDEIMIDFQNLEIMKEILAPFRELGGLNTGGEEESLVGKLKRIKGFAENLRKEGMTINIGRMGEPVMVIGERAKPWLSKLVLGSSIQANITKMISLMRALR